MEERKLQFFAMDLIEKLKLFAKNMLRKERRNPLDPMKYIPIMPIRN